MKNYTITVNGTAYNVTVEEGTSNAPASQAPVSAPVAAPQAAPAKPAAPASAGSVKVDAPMPGNILDIKVSNGASVKAGDVLVILEAMKMENDIVAPCDGSVTSILVNKGDSVNSSDTLATIG